MEQHTLHDTLEILGFGDNMEYVPRQTRDRNEEFFFFTFLLANSLKKHEIFVTDYFISHLTDLFGRDGDDFFDMTLDNGIS